RNGGERGGDSESAAEQRQRKAFGEQLTKQPGAARAHRRADGDFFLPRGRPGEQQIRDVRARDQQNERDRRQQDEQSRLQRRADERVEEGDETDAPVLHLGVLRGDSR